MRPKRVTAETQLAESSAADQRTEGSHQRMVRRLRRTIKIWRERESNYRKNGCYGLADATEDCANELEQVIK